MTGSACTGHPMQQLLPGSVIPRKIVLILRHFEVHGRVNVEAGRKQNIIMWKKFVLQNIQNNFKKWFVLASNVVFTDTIFLEIFICRDLRKWFKTKVSCFLPRNASGRNSESLLLFLFYGRKFRVVFSSAEWFRTELREYASIFCSTIRNTEHFSLVQNGSERNSEGFLFCGTVGIPWEQTICFAYSIFREISLVPRPTHLIIRNGLARTNSSNMHLFMQGQPERGGAGGGRVQGGPLQHQERLRHHPGRVARLITRGLQQWVPHTQPTPHVIYCKYSGI